MSPQQDGPRGQTQAGNNPSDETKPVLPCPKQYIDGYNNYGEQRETHIHAGEDFPCPCGTPLYACEDGTAKYVVANDGYYGFIDLDIGSGLTLRYAHVQDGKEGNFSRGDVIGHSGDGQGHYPCHLHFEVRTDGGGYGFEGTIAPEKFLTGAVEASGDDTTAGGASSGSGTQDAESVAKAAAFSTFINLPGLFNRAESIALQGERSLMNDQPLLPFVQQLVQASLRSFQSMPNGKFFAFYPDYFGGLNHRTAYWSIADIEIIDANINLSDDALATHVYVVGDTANFDGIINQLDEMQTSGVVNIFNGFMANFITGQTSPELEPPGKNKNAKRHAQELKQYDKELAKQPTLADKAKAISFLQKYGARPLYQPTPMIRSPYYELFLAYQTFCLFWAKQFITRFEFTFMPELFPGGIVEFPDHGIQCYVEEVVHNCSYETGFTTQANLSAPSAIRRSGKSVGKKWASQGMVRAGAFTLVEDHRKGER